MSISLKTLYGWPNSDEIYPLKTYREFSTVHHLTADRVAQAVFGRSHEGKLLNILDVGAGNGTFTLQWLTQWQIKMVMKKQNPKVTPVHLDLLEPEPHAIKALNLMEDLFPENVTARIIKKRFTTG